ncbi:MAG: hypothetical protein JO259_08430 [Mycobacterium sp.]|nr:hypothetical protein [Mycobacterium sp.]
MELSRGPWMHYDIGCEIVGSNGALTESPARQPKPGSWMERFHDAYRAQDAAWLATVAARSAAGPSAYDGYANNAVVAAALAALASGRPQPVNLRTESNRAATRRNRR